MPVTRDDVHHIASLARLAVDEARLAELTDQLNGILAHMQVLEKVDTAKVLPAAGVGDAGMPLRVDAGPPYPLERPLEGFAPAMRDGFLLVPRLATHENAHPGIDSATLDEEGEHRPGVDASQSRTDER